MPNSMTPPEKQPGEDLCKTLQEIQKEIDTFNEKKFPTEKKNKLLQAIDLILEYKECENV